jgi:putative methionine-R-sulfoxide reductase with GAF domain
MSDSIDTKQNQPKKTGYSLRARLIIGVMLITGLSIIILTYFNFQRRRESTTFITNLVNQEVKAQSESLLLQTVTQTSEDANQFFEAVSNDVQIVTNYLTTLFSQQTALNTATYWNAQDELTRLSENQWGNSATDPGSVLAPASFELTDASAAKINASILLDLVAPQTLNANPNIKALYFVNDDGVINYYPNIDLANVVGDFDARQRPYYRAVIPEINPDKEPFWTVPYFDAADGSLIETNSIPIYDESGNFKGALAANVNISTVTDIVNEIEVGETGYAFLIDSGGRFIVLPESALTDMGLGVEALPKGGIAQRTVFDTEADIRAIASKMLTGETGLSTFNRDGEDHYLAYAPIEATGYSLGVIVPVNEMLQLGLTIQENVLAEENATFQTTLVLFIVLLLAALLFAYVMGRILTTPLKQLTEAAQEVAEGNFNVEIDTRAGGEVGTLAVAFSEMTHQIQDLIGNLEKRVAERTRALEASMEVSRSVSTILEQQQLLSEVVEQVRAAFNYYHVHIYVVDRTTNDLVMAGGTGEAGQALLGGGHKIAHGKGLVGRAAETKSTVLVSDVKEEAGWLANPFLPDTKAEIAVPIVTGNQVLGVLDVQQNENGSLTEVDAQLLELVANQVGIALRNAQIYGETQNQAKREAQINEISRQIQMADNVENILQTVSRELGYALNAKRVRVQLGTAQSAGNGQKTRGES